MFFIFLIARHNVTQLLKEASLSHTNWVKFKSLSELKKVNEPPIIQPISQFIFEFFFCISQIDFYISKTFFETSMCASLQSCESCRHETSM